MAWAGERSGSVTKRGQKRSPAKKAHAKRKCNNKLYERAVATETVCYDCGKTNLSQFFKLRKKSNSWFINSFKSTKN